MNEANDSTLVTRKLNSVNYNIKSKYDAANEINFNTEIFKSNLCDYNNPYSLVRGNFTVIAALVT